MRKKQYPDKSGKHLTLSERIEIQSNLDAGHSAREIATLLRKSPSTISREIKSRSKYYAPTKNCCANKNCDKRYVCHNTQCKKLCVTCTNCMSFCNDFKEEICKYKALHPLKLCNSCKNIKFCRGKKVVYEAEYAHNLYSKKLKDSRTGFDLSDEEIEAINEMISPLIKQGLSPYVVKETLGDSLPISESTLRRMLDSQSFDVRRIDLREAVKRKPRKNKALRKMKDEDVTTNKDGHKYKDFLDYILDNPDTLIIQMDCVEGLKTDKKTLLTLHLPIAHFQFAFLMDEHNSKCVVKVLDYIEETLGQEMFNLIFGVILTDNGKEFSDIKGMERSIYGGQRTKIFFCEPNRSDQKAECENNHKLIRTILPKKTSFEFLTQEAVTLMMNHINNYKRKSLCGRTPLAAASVILPEKCLKKLGYYYIPSRIVKMNPKLLSKYFSSNKE